MAQPVAVDNSFQRPHGPQLPLFIKSRMNLPETLSDSSFRQGLLRLVCEDLANNSGLCVSMPISKTTVMQPTVVDDSSNPFGPCTRKSSRRISLIGHENEAPALDNQAQQQGSRRSNNGNDVDTTKKARRRSDSCPPTKKKKKDKLSDPPSPFSRVVRYMLQDISNTANQFKEVVLLVSISDQTEQCRDMIQKITETQNVDYYRARIGGDTPQFPTAHTPLDG
jgi:hypothetical protein